MRICLIVIFLVILFISSRVSYAALKLNELYPAPPSGEVEWIELYNDGTDSIDTGSYYLTDLANNRINIPQLTLSPFGFITATSSSILNNNGDTVNLNNGTDTIESIVYSGSFSTNRSHARCPDGNGSWQTTTSITKNQTNNSICPTATPIPQPTLTEAPTTTPIATESAVPTSLPTPTTELTPTPQPTTVPNYSLIFISEALVYPNSGENEWVEIYNNNDFEVELKDWLIDDEESAGSSPKKFTLTLQAKGYGTIALDTSVFNNTGDQVRILNSNQVEKDGFNYSESEKNTSWGRISFENSDFCMQESSKDAQNNPCIENPTPTPALSPTPVTIEPTDTPKQISSSAKTTQTYKNNPIKIPAAFTKRTYLRPNHTNSANTDEGQFKTIQILGTSTENHLKNSHLLALSHALSFASTSFSMLSIIYIALKTYKKYLGIY